MLDLDERLHSLTDALAEGLSLDDPSTPGQPPVPIARRSSHTRRWLAASGVVALAAAAVLGVVVWTAPDDRSVVPAVEDLPPETATTVDPDLAPIDRLRAAYRATIDAPGWSMRSGMETVGGRMLGAEDGTSGGGIQTYTAPGLVSTTSQLKDGTWRVTGYFDLTAEREYWLVGPDRWKSAALDPRNTPDPWYRLERTLDSDVCVAAMQDGRFVVVTRPGLRNVDLPPCPDVAPPEGEWATALPGAKLVVSLTDDGRVAAFETPTGEMPFEVPGIGAVRMVARFSYDDLDVVELPDPSRVTEVVLPIDGTGGGGFSSITGYSFRGDDGPCTEFDQSGCPSG
jgi:hypothetical protein